MTAIRTHAFTDSAGRLVIGDRTRFAEALRSMPDTQGEIVFEPYKRGISHQQRKYFYGVVVDCLHGFFTATGVRCSKQDVVDLLKDSYLFRERMCPITGRFVKVPISLSAGEGAMTKEEFQDKKEAIQQWGAEVLSLDIPDPEKNWRMYKETKNK